MADILLASCGQGICCFVDQTFLTGQWASLPCALPHSLAESYFLPLFSPALEWCTLACAHRRTPPSSHWSALSALALSLASAVAGSKTHFHDPQAAFLGTLPCTREGGRLAIFLKNENWELIMFPNCMTSAAFLDKVHHLGNCFK